MTQIKYPLLVFKEGDNNIYCFRSKFGIASLNGDVFYYNLTIIDAIGNVFTVDKPLKIIKASLLNNLLYLQPMIEITCNFNYINNINIEDIKEKIINHLKKSPTNLQAWDTLENIINIVNASKSINELYLLFE